MAVKRSRNFIYANSSIRIDGERDPHKTWFPTAMSVWNRHINWETARNYISTMCHGTPEGAQIIENTLNRLDKYTGLLAETTVDPNDLAYGINQDLVKTLNQLNLGETTAISLLNYFFTAQSKTTAPFAGTSTAINAGFSFESRVTDFIQRLAQNKDAASRTGGSHVYAGESIMFYLGDYAERPNGKTVNIFSESSRQKLTQAILKDLNQEYKNFVRYTYQEVTRNIKGKIQRDIAVIAYQVPSKIDVTVRSDLKIHASYGELIEQFLATVKGARLSLKNSTDTNVKIGSTNDITRLRGFATQFLAGLDRNFGTICTFIFASKKSAEKGNSTVQQYLDWARILYELIGTGQTAALGQNQDLLVDYLIINNYQNNSVSGGRVSVFDVKQLVMGFPDRRYDPPFTIGGNDNSGHVSLNLRNASNFRLT